MTVIYKLDRNSHGKIEPAEDKDGGVEKTFADLLDAGWSLYDLTDPHAGRLLMEFDPSVEVVVAVPWRPQE